MHPPHIHIRPATVAERDAVNRVIEAAVMGWDLPERVKRLSLPSYRYDVMDFKALHIVVAQQDDAIAGVAAWEDADPDEAPAGATALLLHGIYVAPDCQRKGIGRLLFRAAEEAARAHGTDGLLVKAQESANGFFLAQGMHRLEPGDPSRHYANRFWKPASQ